jgi:hypothetical protein
MISQKKTEANRRNAQHSTGPTSDEGKSVASRNAIKHGIYASNPLLPGEDPAEYALFRAGLLEALQPADAMQDVLADRVISLSWKVRRTGDVEDAILRCFCSGYNNNRNTQSPAERVADFFGGTCDGLQLDHVSQYELRMQRSLQAALRQLKQLQKEALNAEDGDASRDAGLRPVRKTVDTEKDATTRSDNPPHGPEARVTEDVDLRNEPTAAHKALASQDAAIFHKIDFLQAHPDRLPDAAVAPINSPLADRDDCGMDAAKV